MSLNNSIIPFINKNKYMGIATGQILKKSEFLYI